MGASNGGKGRDRTDDTRIFSPLLYQLSYLATEVVVKRGALYQKVYSESKLFLRGTFWGSAKGLILRGERRGGGVMRAV